MSYVRRGDADRPTRRPGICRACPAMGLLILVLLMLAACGSQPTLTPTPTPDLEAAYLDGLTEILEVLDQSFQRFDELMGPTFPRFAPDEIQARVLFMALEEVKISDTMAERLRMLEKLTPPERFAADHATFLGLLREQITLAAAVDDAIQRRDLPHVHLERAELQAAGLVSRIAVSPEFCRYMTPETEPQAGGFNQRKVFCSEEPIPGGEYGATINRLAKTFTAKFGARAGFPPGMTPDELLDGLTYVQPAIVEVFEETLAQLNAIEPPQEYAVGHRVLYDYFDELLSTAHAIDRAVVERDHDGVNREFKRSGQITRSADNRLPDNYRALVEVIFGETPDED